MDARSRDAADDPVIVSGLGHAIVGETACDPEPFLKTPKLRKYMGLQDDLAVVAAGRALQSAGHVGDVDRERVGLYLVVGFIPFEQANLEPLLDASLEDGRFSMERFSTRGFRSVNGLLTFRCLPNMPAFHVSVNFDIQGPYFVTYPGPGQFYLALEEACQALADDAIDVALVGGVAHQRNFLVRYHFSRLQPAVVEQELGDGAGFVALERSRQAGSARGRLLDLRISYRPHDPFVEAAAPEEWLEKANTRSPSIREGWGAGVTSLRRYTPDPNPPPQGGRDLSSETALGQLGAASLPVWLSAHAAQRPGRVRHYLRSRDGFSCTSEWELS